MSYRVTLILVLLPLVAAPVQAGIIFGRKKEKPDPKLRVPELVGILKTDKDADKRSRAAEELRNYDPAAFPDIVPTLIEALHNDKQTGVRIEAVHSLAKLRPISQVVGEALEQAVAKDSSMRVRLQARSALLQYHWAGYRSKKNEVPPLKSTREPPVAAPSGDPPPISTQSPAPPPAAPQPDDASRLRPQPAPPAAPVAPSPSNPPPAAAPKSNPSSSEGPDLP
jgi:hypothetical protein